MTGRAYQMSPRGCASSRDPSRLSVRLGPQFGQVHLITAHRTVPMRPASSQVPALASGAPPTPPPARPVVERPHVKVRPVRLAADDEDMTRNADATSTSRPSFMPPQARPGFTATTVRADQVRVGDRFIPMEGPGHPVGKGQTWRVCSEALHIWQRVRLYWGHDSRWYLPENEVHVMRPEPMREGRANIGSTRSVNENVGTLQR